MLGDPYFWKIALVAEKKIVNKILLVLTKNDLIDKSGKPGVKKCSIAALALSVTF